MNEIYIHYGHRLFEPDKFQEIKNSFVKPTGGLWASQINTKFGWKDWCDEEQFRVCTKENSFCFKLKDSTNVHKIFCPGDVFKLPRNDNVCGLGKTEYDFDSISRPFPQSYDIDFEKCIKLGIDAIELCTLKRGLYWILYGWDCESIIILNKDCIVPLENNNEVKL